MIIGVWRKSLFFYSVTLPLLIVMVVLPGVDALAGQGTQKSFSSPEAAVRELVLRTGHNDVDRLVKVLGPGSRSLVESGDPVADRIGRAEFTRLYEEKHVIENRGANRVVLLLGASAYPFPIPIVKRGGAWRFDTRAGRLEILNRTIGHNELNAIEVAKTYVQAQREYAAMDRNGDGVPEFAQKLGSSPGKHDGLYWPVAEGQPESPLGPLIARAGREGYSREGVDSLEPYHGYYFRILNGQGNSAAGGGFNYRESGRMTLGFALIAFPARYGVSGIMTFIINQEGVVFQKNLGRKTAAIAAKMALYDPDPTWTKVQ